MAGYKNSILITGGTSGLGFETAYAIAKAQPDTEIVIASRSDKAKAADTINKRLRQSNVSFKSLDLSDQTRIRSFVAEWTAESHQHIAALVLNAGLQFPAEEPIYTQDGLEITFGSNHVGHALLFYLLRPHLASDCRIVITSSGTHDPAQKTGVPDAVYTSAEALAHPSGESFKAPGLQRYSTSKLCNVMWCYALDRHVKEKQLSDVSAKWTVTSMCPGLMPDTSLTRAWPTAISWPYKNVLSYMPWLIRWFQGPNVHSSKESGAALARLAISNDLQGVSGKYFEGLKEIKSSDASYDKDNQDELWLGTVKLIAKDEVERQSFESLS